MGVDKFERTPTALRLHGRGFAALLPRMATKTTFVCDCCFREADDNLGWAHVSVNGASDGKQLMPDDNRDLCEICWSPLQTLMKKVHEEAREKRNSSAGATSPPR
jgi:hypothetical protein